MKIDIVIGANYGDEGKGLFTEFLSGQNKSSIVVLTNGGSQRGHTVNDPVYGKHVFHHFGSGTLMLVPTYFASSFLLNPMQFVKEKDELESTLGGGPLNQKVVSYRDPNCMVQLPVDIALNWHIEKCRGETRHGSVGCGIWESTNRVKYSNRPDLRLTLRDVVRRISVPADQRRWIVKILKDESYAYARRRCAEEGITDKIDLLDIFLSNGFIDHYLSDSEIMYRECVEMPFDMLSRYDHAIFENGQGLMLDQFYNIDDIDNTTPSFTGTIGIANLLQESALPLSQVTINYISRTYLTKHGVGKFDAECSGMKFDDLTNIYNEWQGDMRFGELDYRKLMMRINRDFDYFGKICGRCGFVRKNIVFTHCNEIAVKTTDFDRVDNIYTSFTDKSSDIGVYR